MELNVDASDIEFMLKIFKSLHKRQSVDGDWRLNWGRAVFCFFFF